MDMELFIFATAVFTLAGFVKGVVGMGLPTVAMGLLVLVMPPAAAAALLVVPSLLTNIAQMLDGGPLRPILRRLAPMMLGICAGTAAAALVLPAATGDWAQALLGLLLAGSAVMGLTGFSPAIPPRHEKSAAAAVGLVTGGVTVATGVFVIPSVPYLRALALDRETFVRALGLSFTVSSLTLALALAAQGVFRTEVALGSALALLPALVGMWIGARARRRLAGPAFKRVFDLSLLALGLFLVARALL